MLEEPWQFAVLAGAILALLVTRAGVVVTLAGAAVAGVVCAQAGLSLAGG